MTLKALLESRRCFKLVCGAGNEDAEEVEKLVALYAEAGAGFFDLSAQEDVVLAARAGLARAQRRNPDAIGFLNVSVGIKGDPHVSKALIDPQLCTACGTCAENCPQQTIFPVDVDAAGNGGGEPEAYEVIPLRCIGCNTCFDDCNDDAITMISETAPFGEILPPLIELGLDALEFHAVSADEAEVQRQWREVESCFDGILSVCTDRSLLSDRALIERLDAMLAGRDPFTTIIQADGAPMSGSDDEPATTLQALACGRLVQESGLPAFLMLSGGTNSHTARLARTFDIQAHGVAIGSFARALVRQGLDRADFFEDRALFDKMLARARRLVEGTLAHMGAPGGARSGTPPRERSAEEPSPSTVPP